MLIIQEWEIKISIKIKNRKSKKVFSQYLIFDFD